MICVSLVGSILSEISGGLKRLCSSRISQYVLWRLQLSIGSIRDRSFSFSRRLSLRFSSLVFNSSLIMPDSWTNSAISFWIMREGASFSELRKSSGIIVSIAVSLSSTLFNASRTFVSKRASCCSIDQLNQYTWIRLDPNSPIDINPMTSHIALLLISMYQQK